MQGTGEKVTITTNTEINTEGIRQNTDKNSLRKSPQFLEESLMLETQHNLSPNLKKNKIKSSTFQLHDKISFIQAIVELHSRLYAGG